MLMTISATAGSFEQPVVPKAENRTILHLLSDPDIRSLVKRVIKLIQLHEEAKDSLSKDLIKWGKEVCALTLYHAKNEGFVELLAAKVHELRTIAVGKIDYAPLIEPVVANDRVWERWVLEDVRTVFDGISPYDGAKLEEGEEHVFCKEVLSVVARIFDSRASLQLQSLAKRVKALEKSEDRSCFLNQEVMLRITRVRARSHYQERVDEELLTERFQLKAAKKKEEREKLEAMFEATKRATEEHVAFTVEALEESEAFFITSLSHVRRADDVVIDGLKECLKIEKKEREELRDQYVATAERLHIQEGRLAALEGRIRDAEAQNQANKGGGCTVM